MGKRTPLYDCHKNAGAQLVDFAGWDMPLHYGSQIQEHHSVRESAGLFDVSHMGVVDISGANAYGFLRYALANDVEKLRSPGKALYSCMLNKEGGVIDDLIVYRLNEKAYRVVLNAGTRESDLKWLRGLAKAFEVTLKERNDLSVLALQGPNAMSLLSSTLTDINLEALNTTKAFEFFTVDRMMFARTGYTGEDGVEMIVPNDLVVDLWRAFLDVGVPPCGLGARDTLRLEAGFNLYGSDMDENTSPLVSNLSWTVSFKDKARDFVGRKALEAEKETGISQKLVGLVMEAAGVLRNHQKVFINGVAAGEITSGSFSPTLGHAIALARVPIDASDVCEVERRGKRIPVKIIRPPFINK